MYLNKSAKLHQWSNFFISSELIQTLLVSSVWWMLYSESSASFFFVADASDWPAAESVPFLPDGNGFYWCDGAQNQHGVEGTQVSFCILHKSTSHFCSCLWVKPSRAFSLGRERKWVATLSFLVCLWNAWHWLSWAQGNGPHSALTSSLAGSFGFLTFPGEIGILNIKHGIKWTK